MNVSYYLIQEFVKFKRLRYLTVLIKLKSIYSSGCVHNYTPFKLAKSCHLSRNSVKKYVQWFLDNGFARMEGNDLVFNKFKNIHKKYSRGLLKLDTSLSVKKIEVLFNKEIMLDKVRKFRYKQQISKDLKSRERYSAAKRFARLKGERILPSADANYSVSIKKLSKHFNCSVGKAQRIVNLLCEENVMRRIQTFIPVQRKNKCDYQNRNLLSAISGSWVSGGQVFQRKKNVYIF